jgi:hypothetical protein
MEKHFVDLPYKLKTDGKLIGAKYDDQLKRWYITDKSLLPDFELVDIDVPFGFSDIAKDAGAQFNKETKRWNTCRFNLSRLEDVLTNDDNIKLKQKELELKNNTQYKIISNIEKINLLYEKYGIKKT